MAPEPAVAPGPDDVRLGKLLSLVLRHRPELAGLALADGGWAPVDDLLAGLARLRRPVFLSREDLRRIVETNGKQRFTHSADGALIRAAQGHSVDVELHLAPQTPPLDLFHGTARAFVESIFRQGLLPRKRQHVHLSVDVATAKTVGARHGEPLVLQLDTRAMLSEGAVFFRADNGVWLTPAVPPRHLRVVAS